MKAWYNFNKKNGPLQLTASYICINISQTTKHADLRDKVYRLRLRVWLSISGAGPTLEDPRVRLVWFWSPFVGIYRQRLTKSSQNCPLNTPTNGQRCTSPPQQQLSLLLPPLFLLNLLLLNPFPKPPPPQRVLRARRQRRTFGFWFRVWGSGIRV